MKLIPIVATPNQTLSFSEGGSFYTIRLASRSGSVNMDLTVDNEVICLGARIVAGAAILQSRYLLKDRNFVIVTNNNELVDYSKFGSTQFMYLYTRAEVANAS